jgi:Concanavalin A-like lectin/glucanases superfamily
MQKHLLTAMAVLCFALAAAQPTTGLVAYWPMNGNFNDAGPNALNGTNMGGITAALNKNGVANSAMEFSNPSPTQTNVAQYALLPTSSLLNFSGTQNFSIVFWMYINAPVIHAGGMYENNLNTAGPGVWMWTASGFPQIQFNYKNNSIGTPNGAITTGGWYNVACIRNNGSLSTYINGSLSISGPEGLTAPTYPIPARFGTMSSTTFPPSNNYNGFNGRLDEMRVYNRALTAAEILQIYTLPVKLTSFTAALYNGDVALNWQTEYEQNSSHFNVQRSTDGVNFNTIGTVQAKGTTTIASSYQYLDNSIKTLTTGKTIFYRLHQVDKDGRSAMSSIVSVKYEPAASLLTLLQNPAVNDVRIQVSLQQKTDVQLTITDAMGRAATARQMTMKAGQNFTALPVHLLAAGTYYITVTAGTKKQTLAFIKQ